MPQYLLLHTDETPFPSLTPQELAGFQQAWEGKRAAGIQLLETQVGAQGRGYCRFAAPSLAALQAAVQEITGKPWPPQLVAAEVEQIVKGP